MKIFLASISLLGILLLLMCFFHYYILIFLFYNSSITEAAPCPVPTHIETIPYFTPLISFRQEVEPSILVPVQPRGVTKRMLHHLHLNFWI